MAIFRRVTAHQTGPIVWVLAGILALYAGGAAAQVRPSEVSVADFLAITRQGRALLRQGDGAGALVAFDSALQASGSDSARIVTSWVGRGRALTVLGRLDEAEVVLGAALAHYDASDHTFNRVVMRLSLARLEARKGNPKGVAAWLDESLALAMSMIEDAGLARLIQQTREELLGGQPGG